MHDVLPILYIYLGLWAFIGLVSLKDAIDLGYFSKMPDPILAGPQCQRIHLGPALIWGKGEGDTPENIYQCLTCTKFMTPEEATTFINIRQSALVVMRDALVGAKAKP